MKRAGFAYGALALLASVAFLSGQSGRTYDGNHVWWDAGDGGILPWEEDYSDPTGQITILNTTGFIHTRNHAFFEPLGVNGRACVTCHQPSNAMSVSAASARSRWTGTPRKDPLFAAIDGSNCPDLPQGAVSSHSLLLDRGLFRISLPWPPKSTDAAALQPEFRIEVLRDPTGCNQSPIYGIDGKNQAVSVYRRPRVAANLRHVIAGPGGTSFMADSREPSLRPQAINAAMIHEQAEAAPSSEQIRQIIDFETQIYVAQSSDIRGGLLDEKTGPGSLGPENLSAAGSGLPEAFSFAVWKKPGKGEDRGVQREFRASVARGSDVFFGRQIQLRDAALVTCASCHKAGTTRWMDVGTTNVDITSNPTALGAPDLPLFRITCKGSAPPHPLLGRVIFTQDPGRALISGKCADVGSIVVPQLRGLAARAPYFSNGTATSLRDVVEFYDKRFGIRYTEQEKQDLVNFLSAL
jgi:cytochrome c553